MKKRFLKLEIRLSLSINDISKCLLKSLFSFIQFNFYSSITGKLLKELWLMKISFHPLKSEFVFHISSLYKLFIQQEIRNIWLYRKHIQQFLNVIWLYIKVIHPNLTINRLYIYSIQPNNTHSILYKHSIQ